MVPESRLPHGRERTDRARVGRALVAAGPSVEVYGRSHERATLPEAWYLISGTDRPKVETARTASAGAFRARVRRDRIRPRGERRRRRHALQLRQPVRGRAARRRHRRQRSEEGYEPPPTVSWKAADVEAISTYLAAPAPNGARSRRGRDQEGRSDREGVRADRRPADLDVGERGRVASVAERFRQAGVEAEADAWHS